MKKRVSIFGACGRIGLPLTWMISNAGYKVTGIDPNYKLGQNLINDPVFPYTEEGFSKKEHKKWSVSFLNVDFTPDCNSVCDADIILIIIGTPVDGENNPRIENIVSLFENDIIPRLTSETMIILRSTVSPGVTELIKNMIKETRPELVEGVDYFLIFAPERVSEGHSIEETPKLPQLIGAFSEPSYIKAVKFFETIGADKFIPLTPCEAEYGKLITNMYRYVNIALANEMYMIGAEDNVDMHKIINACNFEYPRMNMPRPGPNSAGPCLFKDGRLLVENVPYGDLINVAFHVNEGMPNYMVKLMENHAKKNCKVIKRVAILGMTFKPESNDTRFSASFKLKKILLKKGIKVVEIDEYLNRPPEISDEQLRKIDAFIVMTPHKNTTDTFFTLATAAGLYPDTIIVDGWKALGNYSKNGIYNLGDIYKNE